MTGHADLLDSDSIGGGYQVATTVTQPDAKGVTRNANATVTTQNGAATVTFDGDGSYGIDVNGSSIALQRGQSLSLGSGERVSVNDDSSLTVSDRSGSGGSISTTMRSNRDGGVDVTDSANDIDLGGYLVTHTDASPVPPGGTQPIGYPPYQPLTTAAPYQPPTTSVPYDSQTSYDGSEIEFA